jgi:hypothetical protein
MAVFCRSYTPFLMVAHGKKNSSRGLANKFNGTEAEKKHDTKIEKKLKG